MPSSSKPFAAKFTGRCHAGDHIELGDEIQFAQAGYDGMEVVVHVGCADQIDQSTPQRDDSAPYCGACFMFHRGDECL